MFNKFKQIGKSERGSVASDWVVMTALLIFMSALVMAKVPGAAVAASNDINTSMAAG